SFLKDEGYTTTAIHPFNGGMYKRNIALKNEGFDEFITDLEMDFTEHDGASEYINDRSAYQQTLKALQEGSKRQVIGLITMQNHTPFKEENYESRDFGLIRNDYTAELEDWRETEIETYFQTIHSYDEYLGEFIAGLEQLDKKVVVLFFGDHSPGLFDITNSNGDKEVRDLSRVTPYFIYTNYDAGFTNKELPTTTPNCMVNTMLNSLNWRKNARYYLLDEVCREEPILTATWLDGRDINEESDLLKSYELLTYDILGGKKYWHDN
ncbi:LTA synthase family protein, partial [Candidatus Saccharibacteria bacterium]|nr:LTA synthase family protein [Candidatus Saccharibacteria bacterium]